MQTTTYLAVDPADLRQIVAAAVSEALAAHTPPTPPAPGDADQMLTCTEVADMLHLSLVTLRELERRRELTLLGIARRVLYQKGDVMATLDRRNGRGNR